MQFRQIQYFVCLYEEGSVTRAARRLNIVQPALSMQIAKLEEEVGRPLFHRTSQGMRATATGREMYRLFLPVLGDFARARDRVMQGQGELVGHVNIGVVATVAQGVVAQTVLKFTAKHPKVSVTIADGYTSTLSDWVSRGQIEAAVVNKPPRRLGLNIAPIYREDMVLVTGPRHKDIGERVPFRKVATLRLVLPTRNHGLRDILESFAEASNVELGSGPALELDSIAAIIQVVQQGELATLLPRIAVHQPIEAGSLRGHRVVAPMLTRDVVWLTHPRRPPAPATSAFFEMLTEHARGLQLKGVPRKKALPRPRAGANARRS